MIKPFNRDELEMLMVVSDLLCKGEVETRIAKYMHEKKWSPLRVQKFLAKCLLSDKWYNRIWIAYQDYNRLPDGDDPTQHLGKSLKQTALFHPEW
jgi:hypothetical protein